MKTEHKQFLFTSCDVLKNKQVRTAKKWVFFMHHNNVFVLYILIFFLIDQQRLEANNCENTSFNQYDTNESSSQTKSQYVWNETFQSRPKVSPNFPLFTDLICVH